MPTSPERNIAPKQDSDQEESGIRERPTAKAPEAPETARLAPEQYEAYQKSVEEGVGQYVADTDDFFRQSALLKRLSESQSPLDAELRREATEKILASFDAVKFVDRYGSDADQAFKALSANLEMPKDVAARLENKVVMALRSRPTEATPTLNEAPPANLLKRAETLRREPTAEDLMRSTRTLVPGEHGWEPQKSGPEEQLPSTARRAPSERLVTATTEMGEDEIYTARKAPDANLVQETAALDEGDIISIEEMRKTLPEVEELMTAEKSEIMGRLVEARQGLADFKHNMEQALLESDNPEEVRVISAKLRMASKLAVDLNRYVGDIYDQYDSIRQEVKARREAGDKEMTTHLIAVPQGLESVLDNVEDFSIINAISEKRPEASVSTVE